MGERYYLDTSALVKRYVKEPGSEVVDEVFMRAHAGEASIALSYWNIGEAAVVFDKYERRTGLDATAIFHTMLRELRMLARARYAILVGVTPRILRESIILVLKHHVYIADALQVTSAKRAKARKFLTGDEELARVARAEGLETIYLPA